MALLSVENVRAGYGTGPDILNGLTLKVESNQTHCIIGPNGAGKSTLLRVICGLLHPREGRVLFDGVPIQSLQTPDILRKGVSFIPSDRCLFPEMTVLENLRMGGHILKNPKSVSKRIDEIMERFPILQTRRGQLAKTLSGGEQKMLALGRSLVLQPKLIMLDEPSLGLAPKVSKQVFENIKDMAHSGMSVLLVEQNARMGLECANWGHVLDFGKNSFEGPSSEILSDKRIQELYLGKSKPARKKEAE
ncbi:MAG: ABC transporter ATP-binding protein [Deltaproteobacteria bacterium]|nr:ABC transporter ATP-binding protein [Deltaproteobacteria bacterium]